MIRSGVDKRTVKDMVTKSGYDFEEFEVEVIMNILVIFVDG